MSVRTTVVLVILLIGLDVHFREPAKNDFHMKGYTSQSIRAGVQTATLSTGVQLEFIEQGRSEGIPLIFLHGIGDTWHSFDLVMPLLPPSQHVFVLTQRGHGQSSKPATGYAPPDFAADVRAFMDLKGIPKAILVGHSMGGVNIQQFALNYPERVAALVIIDSDVSFGDNPGMREFNEHLKTLSGSFDKSFMIDFQRSTLNNPIDSVYFELLVDEAIKIPVSAFAEAFDSLLDVNFAEEIKGLQVPVLAFWGDKDSFTGRSDQEIFQKNLRDVQLKIYENTGHALHWEQPERFAGDLLQFLAAKRLQTSEVLPPR